ncbi:hypothetical protein Tco_0999074 [Tanacetum coccineum]
MAGALPSDTVKNPKLSSYPVLSTHYYPTKDPQCSTHIYGLINTITINQGNLHDKPKVEEQKGEGNPENTNTVKRKEEQRDTPQPELKDLTAIDKIRPSRNDEDTEWLDVEEPLNLADIGDKAVYELLIKEMPRSDLVSSRIVLSEEVFMIGGCRKPSDLKYGVY